MTQTLHPDMIYYKFTRFFTYPQITNCAQPWVGFFGAGFQGLTITPGGQFDSCITGAGWANSGVITGWNCNLGTSSWTLSMWLTIPTTSSGSAYYLFGDAGSGLFRCFHNGIALPDNLVLRGNFTDVTVTGIGPNPTVVTFVYDSVVSQIRVYKNGVLSVTSNQTLNIPTGTGFKVGSYSSSQSFIGKMDEFRLYRIALTPAEVAASWNYNGLGCLIDPITIISEKIPNQFSLSQNYPNPFNPKTVISFQLARLRNGQAVNSFATLKVYDLIGREVATLVNENLNAGTYEVEFPAPSEDGTNYSSGVYYYKLNVMLSGAEAYTETKKMVLLK